MPKNLNYRYSRGAEKLIYDADSKVLKTAFGQFIKNVCCALDKRWDELEPVEGSTIKRRCTSCQKNVLDIEQFSSDQIQAIVQYDPDVCVYFTNQSPNIDIRSSDSELRHIQTARTPESINYAVEQGYWPLLKDVVASPGVSQKLLVYQDPKTGKTKVSSDYRSGLELYEGTRLHHYNPECYPYSFAAYLLPADLKEGEKVILDDLIEEVVGASWNQGDTYRLKTAKAIWDGKDFDILFEETSRIEFIG